MTDKEIKSVIELVTILNNIKRLVKKDISPNGLLWYTDKGIPFLMENETISEWGKKLYKELKENLNA